MSAAEDMNTFEAEFARCADWLQAALDAGGNTHTLNDIKAAICAGRMQFWPAERAAAVTEIIVYPRAKALHIFLAGGDMGQIIDMEASAAEFGRLNGCDRISIAGRRGWVRALKDHGYAEALTVMGREMKT